MITFNNPEDSQRRQNVEPLSVEDIEQLIEHLNSILPNYGKVISDNLQRLLDHYSNLLRLSSNVGGWEGLAKPQEIADSRQWISVEDRLPEHVENVIIQYKNLSSKVVGVGYFSTTTKTWYVFDIEKEIGRSDVIQWQPMPEPPKSK